MYKRQIADKELAQPSIPLDQPTPESDDSKERVGVQAEEDASGTKQELLPEVPEAKESDSVLVVPRHEPVSYTHLDVYKRQALALIRGKVLRWPQASWNFCIAKDV